MNAGILIGFSGGISGGSSSSAAAGADFDEAVFTSTDLGGLEATVSKNETGAATAGFEVTLKAGGVAIGFAAGGEGLLGSTGAGLASTTVSLKLASTGFSFAAVTLHSTGAETGTNASPFLAFPCLPALTTFGVNRFASFADELPGVEARGDGTGDKGVEEGVDFGEVGEEEEADIEDRFLLPGTAFGAEEPCILLAFLPLVFAGPEAA